MSKGPCPLKELERLTSALNTNHEITDNHNDSEKEPVNIIVEALIQTVDTHPGYIQTDQENNTEVSNYPHWANIAGKYV